MNILITGITGFVGSHMADFLLNKNKINKIYGIVRRRSDITNIKHLFKNDMINIIDCDLLDGGSLMNLIEISKPDIIFHFAAQSFPGISFKSPIITLNTNIIGTTNLFEVIKKARDNNICDPVIISVSSSEVYGIVYENEIPISENNPIRAANPYSISKVGHDLMSQYYHKAYGLKIIVTRMFSHEGARRGKEFAISSFAHQIVKHEKSINFPNNSPYGILHGNLDSIRTYLHIDDAVQAYWLCSEITKYGEIYNIGGNESSTIGEILDILIEKSKFPRVFIKKINNDNIRATDITLQIPDSSKFREETGWFPEKSIINICDDLLYYWRKEL